MNFDWLDGIFIVLGFLLVILIGTIAPQAYIPTEHLPMIVICAPLVRRKLLGPPKLPLKNGLFWSVVSITGLLVMFSSLVMFWFANIAFHQSREPMPNFRAEIEDLEKQNQDMNDKYAPVLLKLSDMSVEEQKKKQQEDKKQRDLESKKRVEISLKKAEATFVVKQKERAKEGLYGIMIALGLALIGSLCLYVRRSNATEMDIH